VESAVICLDANYLIGGTSHDRPESGHLLRWIDDGEIFCTPAPAWYEFLCGPAKIEDVAAMSDLVGERIVPFDSTAAALAAELFNNIGRPRTRRVDVMIAAIAILQGAKLATLNSDHFQAMTRHGLELAAIPGH
jgi:predicted nucleic acid-binding protein